MPRSRVSSRRPDLGSRNVFADLGFPDAEEHLLKADLVSRLHDIIRERNLTQTRAGKLLGLSQPDVSRLLRGNFRDFSLERLFRFLLALDRDIDIVIRPRPASPRRPSRLHVVPA